MSIEKNPKCTQFIKENILKLGTTKSRTKQIDAFKYIKETKLTFDLIFADPPFNFEEKMYINLIELILQTIDYNTTNINWCSFNKKDKGLKHDYELLPWKN